MTDTDHRLAVHHRLVLLAARVWLRHRSLTGSFRRIHCYLPNPARPRRYVEKMLWRKLFDRDPRFVTFTDKLAANHYTPSARLPCRSPARGGPAPASRMRPLASSRALSS